MKHLLRAAFCATLSNWGVFTSFFYMFGSSEELMKRVSGALVILCFAGALGEWAMVEKKRYEDEYGEL
jgi:hypothetical protein